MTRDELLGVIAEYGGCMGMMIIVITLLCYLNDELPLLDARRFLVIGTALLFASILITVRNYLKRSFSKERNG